MNFLLDTNIYFQAIHDPTFLERYRDMLLRVAPRTFLSSVVRAELTQGAQGEFGRTRIARAVRQLERVGRTIAPTHRDWTVAGTVQGRIWDDHASLRSKRVLHDILVVCAARSIGALVVTENVAEFALIARYLPHRAATMAELESLVAV
jgi:predicted nucleic acid-binding protein